MIFYILMCLCSLHNRSCHLLISSWLKYYCIYRIIIYHINQ
nr:MAG TPA: hypothetical protein [Crassvirales sp.]